MYRLYKKSKFVLLIAMAIMHFEFSCAAQEGFREPTIPTAEPDVSAMGDVILNRATPLQEAPAPSADGFVPAVAPETRLTPVAPRGTRSQDAVVSPPGLIRENSYRPSMEPDTESSLEPIVPGRANLRSVIEGFEDFEEDAPAEPVGPEVIRQRYPDGKIQVLREVAQDKEGNYYNHGEWKLFNRQGQILAEGQFRNGVMDGVWRRWHPSGSGGIFTTPPFNLFRGPFLSAATFSDGNLDGVWTLMDHFERKIFEIPYRDGKRNGTAAWWFPSSMKMREVSFKDGFLDGTIREWNKENKLTRQDEYIEGKKIIRQTTFYRPKQKQAENIFLDQKLEPSGPDDWWQAKPAAFKPTGRKLQHGPAYAWYDNGQPKMKGQYKDDVRVGPFTWWHTNGQKQLSGNYDELGKKSGKWSWWHDSGLRAIQGQYEDDEPAGIWRWWDEDGQVSNEEDMDRREEDSVMTEPPESESDDANETEPEPFAVPDIVPENEAEFRDPMNQDVGRVIGDDDIEASIIESSDSTEDLEEIFGEGEVDLLPEGRLVPDDDDGQ